MDEAERALRVRAKQELRQRMRSVRRLMPDASRAQRSTALCERVLALPELANARVVVGYVAARKEADPSAVLQAMAARGAAIGLPRVLEDGGLDLLVHEQGRELEPNNFDILEPPADAPKVVLAQVDVILVPALAADARGHRIGYGRGYYDRLLPRLPRAFKIAVVYDFQLLAELPDTEGDVPVDCVVSDKSSYRIE